MPVSSSIEEMLSRVEKIAEQFGQQATDLSELLEQFQNRLRSLPGKRGVAATEKDVTLTFDRGSSGAWSLFIGSKEYNGELVNAPVLLKAKAYQLLPQLMTAIERQQRAQLEELKIAVTGDRLDAAGQAQLKKEGR